jgi:hypothetical protein
VEGLDVWGLTPWVVDAAAPFAKALRPRERVHTEAWVRKHESSVGPRSIAAVLRPARRDYEGFLRGCESELTRDEIKFRRETQADLLFQLRLLGGPEISSRMKIRIKS